MPLPRSSHPSHQGAFWAPGGGSTRRGCVIIRHRSQPWGEKRGGKGFKEKINNYQKEKGDTRKEKSYRGSIPICGTSDYKTKYSHTIAEK